MGEFVSFYTKGQPLEVYSIDNFKQYTARELLEYFGRPNKILFVRTPKYIELIPPNSKPFESYPQLILSKQPKPYDRPEYMLLLVPESDSSIVYISVQPKSNPHIDIPPFYIEINMKLDVSKKSSDLLEYIVKKFGFTVQNAKLSFLNTPVEETDTALTIIACAKKEQLNFEFDISEAELNKLKKRAMVIMEIIETEKKYLSDLDTLTNFWEKKMRDEVKMSSVDLNCIFKGIDSIMSCHSQFLEGLTKNGQGYAAKVAETFIEFGPHFKASQQYITNFPNSTNLLSQYEKKSKFNAIMKRLITECNGRDLNSYLITPVQRMPRYILFLREVIKSTPPSHPDYELMEVASEKIEKVTKEIDETSMKIKIQEELNQIQKDISSQFVFMDKPRELISETIVQIIDKKVSKGLLFFFDDLILIVKQSKSYKIVYDSSTKNFIHRHRYPDSQSITIDVSEKPYSRRIFHSHTHYQIRFFTEAEFEHWFTDLHKHTSLMMLKSPAKLALEFRNPPFAATLPPYMRTQAVRISGAGTVILIGNGKGPNNVFSINLKNWTAKRIMCQLPVLGGFTAVSSGRTVFILNGSTLIRYETKSNSFETIEVSKEYVARQHHSCVVHETNLIVFGGVSNQSVLMNDVVIIDTSSGKATVLHATSAPAPRRDHAVAVIDGKMYVFGGRTRAGPTNELFAFDLEEHSWQPFPAGALIPCAGHTAISVNSTIVFLGGDCRAQHVDVRTGDMGPIEAFGNLPIGTKHLSAAPLKDNESIVIFDDDNNLYTTEFPQRIRARDAKSRDTNWQAHTRRSSLHRSGMGGSNERFRIAQSDIGALGALDDVDGETSEVLHKPEKTVLEPMRRASIEMDTDDGSPVPPSSPPEPVFAEEEDDDEFKFEEAPPSPPPPKKVQIEDAQLLPELASDENDNEEELSSRSEMNLPLALDKTLPSILLPKEGDSETEPKEAQSDPSCPDRRDAARRRAVRRRKVAIAAGVTVAAVAVVGAAAFLAYRSRHKDDLEE